jgi:phosphoribosylamine--glycine ligase
VATTVVMVSGGYPGDFEKGKSIRALDTVKESIVFHSGTKQVADEVVTNGGRVLAITSFGKTIKEAVTKSLAAADKIKYDANCK